MDVEGLRKWFLRKKRPMPWRDSPTPYMVWISEIMLQQTQVKTVIPYYKKWMDLFPSVSDLASSDVEKVIKAWEGLGYYSRARNIHKAAKYIVQFHNGKIPNTEAALKKIPGIGPYTVGAILSFAFREKAAAVDGNVKRVISRFFKINESIEKLHTQKLITKKVESLLSDMRPWEIMEAFIELGACICKKKPSCFSCPIRKSCGAYLTDEVGEYPRQKARPKTIHLYRDVLVLVSSTHLLIREGTPEKKIMKDLYEFPYIQREDESGGNFPRAWRTLFLKNPIQVRDLESVAHSFTRYRATLYPTLWEVDDHPQFTGYVWVHKKDIHNFPFSSGHKRVLESLSL